LLHEQKFDFKGQELPCVLKDLVRKDLVNYISLTKEISSILEKWIYSLGIPMIQANILHLEFQEFKRF